MKTSGVVSTSNKNYGAELMATYWNPDGTTKDFHSESIVGTTDHHTLILQEKPLHILMMVF